MSRKPKRETDLDDFYEKGDCSEDLRRFATASIKLFFEHKRRSSGEKIPASDLLSEASQKIVLYTQFDDQCFDYIHEHCLVVFPASPKYKDTTVPWTVHCLLGLLAELKSLEIPKEFQPGLLLLYFNFCHDIEIPVLPLL